MIRRAFVGLAAFVVALGVAASSGSASAAPRHHVQHRTAAQWVCEEQIESSPNGWGNYCYGPIGGGSAQVQDFLRVIEQQNASHGQKDVVILYSGLGQSLDSQYVLMLSSKTGCVNDGVHNIVPSGYNAKMGSIDARVDALFDHPPIHMHDSVLSARNVGTWANGADCDFGFGPYGWDNPQLSLTTGCSWSPMASGFSTGGTRINLNGNIGPMLGTYNAVSSC